MNKNDGVFVENSRGHVLFTIVHVDDP